MNTFRTSLQLKPYADEAVYKVFQSLFRVELKETQPSTYFREHAVQVIGMVAVSGLVKGVVCLRLSKSFAQKITAQALPELAGSDVTAGDINDAVSEVTNIITGHLQEYLVETPIPLRLSLPTLVRGIHLDLESIEGVNRYQYTYAYENEVIVLELCLLENPRAEPTYIPKILVIDFQAESRAQLRKFFAAYLCKIIEAESEDQGLTFARLFQPELILLDQLTAISGVVYMLEAIKQNPLTKACAVIVLANETNMEEMNLWMGKGALYYFVKDFNRSLLQDAVIQKLRLEVRTELKDV